MTRRGLAATGIAASIVIVALLAIWLVATSALHGSALPIAPDAWTSSSSIHSDLLGRDMPVEAFVPEGAPSTALLILFHGRGGGAHDWMEGFLGNGVHIDDTAHRLIGDKMIRPVSIVSVSIDSSYGVDSGPADDGYSHGPYGAYIETELLPSVIERWGQGLPVYVGGLSMGGYVALRLALAQPDGFAGVAALSPAFWVKPPSDRTWMYQGAGGDPIALAGDGAADHLALFLGYGRSDYDWIKAATDRLSQTLAARGLPVQPVIVPGGHETSTWHALTEPMLMALFGSS